VMTATAFLEHLSEIGVEIEARRGRLRCRSPKGVLTPDLRAELADRKAELMALLKNGGKNKAIKRVPRNREFPLSFSQRRLWFLYQLDRQNHYYNIPEAIRIDTPLSVCAMEQTLSEIVRRHEILRTNFLSVSDDLIQVIAPAQSLSLDLIDLGELGSQEREAAIRRLARAEARRPFNLERDSPIRAALVRIAPDNHLLLLTLHHIVSDGWSTGVLLGETASLYNSFSCGSPSALREHEIQYVDYACWEREYLDGPVLGDQLAYWKRQLDGASPALELPTDKPRPPAQSFRGAHETLILPPSLLEDLKALSRREGVTLFVTLLTAFKSLLYLYTGQEDISVGSPTAGRSRLELEGLIGLFINILVLRTDLSGDPSFRQLLRRVREVVVGAYANQDLPFDKLVEALQPQRDLTRNLLFQALFLFQNTPFQSRESSTLSYSKMEVESGKSLFDLTLTVTERGINLSCELEYSTDLFEPHYIRRFLAHFQRLLGVIVADPERRISIPAVLVSEEQHQLTIEWNDSVDDFPRVCVHHMIETQALKTPDHVAVVFEGQQLTYAELDRLANRMARYLRSRGVAPEWLVGICAKRSLRMVISLLAVLKTGAAYVPLDASYPKERLGFILEDAAVRVLISEKALVERFPILECQVVLLDEDWESIVQESSEPFGAGAAPENLAYVIYTSGSTGQPKGAAMPHQTLVNLLWWQKSQSPTPIPDRTLQFTPLSFDVSFQEIFSTWCMAGTLVLISDELRRDLPALSRYLEEYNVARLFLPFIALQYLAESCAANSLFPESLCEVITAGEQLQISKQVAEFFFRLKNCRLHNQYGPSESHVVTSYSLLGAPVEWPSLPPIGRPIANTRIYVLNHNLDPAPIGVTGEIYIGGVGVGRGYPKHADLTAERFVPDPMSPEYGSRVYRTGDQARYLSSGNIEFLGRNDDQVKIRGFRVELGEVEAVLRKHAEINNAVVLARPDSAGQQRLVAYVIAAKGATMTAGKLSTFLKEKLPDYMAPADFVFLDALPRTPSGKIDRRSLPEPIASRPESASAIAEMRSPIEEALIEIWRQVLGVECVGINDNFFELGGHSLSATQVILRASVIFDVDLALRSLFDRPTVASLASHIEQELRAAHGLTIPPIVASSNNQPARLSFGQQRLWFLDQFEKGRATYNLPARVRLVGLLRFQTLDQCLKEVVRRHEVLRTIFTAADGTPLPIVMEESCSHNVVIAICDLQGMSGELQDRETRRLVAEEARRPFQLDRWPLFRVTLLQLKRDEYILLLTMHHIVSDGWSTGVLIRELSVLYAAYGGGDISPLRELPIQYGDYAEWQRNWLDTGGVQKQLNYWLEQLNTKSPPILTLPYDRQRPPVLSMRGSSYSIDFPPELSAQLKAFNRREGVTLFMTLLAAFQSLLYKWAGQEDLIIGTPIAGRLAASTEALIGLFINTLALRVEVKGDYQFRELLRRVRETTLDAYAHQGLPFEMLVEQLQPERNLSYSPIFQVMLTLQNATADAPSLPGLTMHWWGSDTATAKFDLELTVIEAGKQLTGVIEYSTSLFDRSTIVRLADQYLYLLRSVLNDPQLRIDRIPLLTEQERHSLLFECNDTETRFPIDRCFHRLFEEQVESTPQAIAAACADEQLSYECLNRQAGHLAFLLREQGVGPEVLVALAIPRGLSLLTAIIATFKAGGSYLPLDLNYPARRVRLLLEQSGASLVLVAEEFEPAVLRLLEDIVETRRPALKKTPLPVSPEIAAPTLSASSDPGNLAYVIYTSGSTGIPKGAMIEQRGMANHLYAKITDLQLAQADRIAQTASACFDISVWQFLAALLVGASVEIIKDEIAQDPERLFECIEDKRVTILEVVPSLLHSLFVMSDRNDSPVRDLEQLRWLVMTGESLPPELCRRWLKDHPQIPMVNAYGPTECSDDVTHHFIGSIPAGDLIRVPIGCAIHNTQLYVGDRGFLVAPRGVSGELLVGGYGVGRGYYQDPARTAEVFIPNHFHAAGDRLYRTGDLAKYLSNNLIDCLGRIDHQVKLRGSRIELEEIESRLKKHPAVEAAIVTTNESRGERRLLAYLVCREGSTLDVGGLKTFVHDELPDYMVPTRFVTLDQFPLTPNGKIDRRALPVPDWDNPVNETAWMAPRNPDEEVAANIFATVLGLPQVGVTDNFFDLGGHSLLATQIISRLRDAFGIEMPLRSLFETPTVAGLCSRLREIKGSENGVRTINPISRDGELPLSFSQQRLWFIDQLIPNSPAYNISNPLHLKGELKVIALEQSINEIIRRHEVLHTTFPADDGKPSQVISEPQSMRISLADLSGLPVGAQATEHRRLVAEERGRPFSLTSGPLLRTALIRLNDLEHTGLLTLHHIVSDGWSAGILVRELASLTQSFIAGMPPSLPELSIQYADFAFNQRQWSLSEGFESQLSYWKQQLSGAPPLIELPISKPRPPVQSFRGTVQSFLLHISTLDALKELSRREGATLFMCLLAVFKILLSRYTNVEDIVVGTNTANRNKSEIEGLIGCFANNIVLRTDLSGNPTIRELLHRVRKVCLDAYTHQELPFEVMVNELLVERDLSYNPLFQVLFVLQTNEIFVSELSGVTITALKFETEHVPFDLVVDLFDTKEGLIVGFRYNTDIFSEITIGRMLRSYRMLLEEIADNPTRKLADLVIADEIEQLVCDFNDDL